MINFQKRILALSDITLMHTVHNAIACIIHTHVILIFLIDTVEVLHDYNAEQPDELTLRTGDIIKICRRLRGGWSKGEINGRRGIFHEFFVKRELIVSIKLAHVKSTYIIFRYICILVSRV